MEVKVCKMHALILISDVHTGILQPPIYLVPFGFSFVRFCLGNVIYLFECVLLLCFFFVLASNRY